MLNTLTTTVLTDLGYIANEVNTLVGAQTPYNLISVGSPRSKTDLENSASVVGANVVTQINNPHDPVANSWINEDANYEVDYNPVDNIRNKTVPIPIVEDLIEEHSFDNYYQNEGIKEEIEKIKNNE